MILSPSAIGCLIRSSIVFNIDLIFLLAISTTPYYKAFVLYKITSFCTYYLIQ